SRPSAWNRIAVALRVASVQPASPEVQLSTSTPNRPRWPVMPGNGSGFGTGGDCSTLEHAASTLASSTPSATARARSMAVIRRDDDGVRNVARRQVVAEARPDSPAEHIVEGRPGPRDDEEEQLAGAAALVLEMHHQAVRDLGQGLDDPVELGRPDPDAAALER